MRKKIIPSLKLPQKPTYTPFGIVRDFYSLFERIEQEHEVCFLLESLSDDESLSRYSIIGFAPQYTIQANGNALTIDDKKYIVDNPYEVLRTIIPQRTISRNYAGGLVGYLSYDAASYVEESFMPQSDAAFGQFQFGVYIDGLIELRP